MVKISQAQTPVGSTQGGVPFSRVNTNPDNDDDDEREEKRKNIGLNNKTK